MLNEFLEFEAYVTAPESITPRVQPNLLTNQYDKSGNLIGIERVMTVIARAFIFSDERYSSEEVISSQVVEDTIELLHRWTGFGDIEKRKRTQNERVDKWMKSHAVTDSWLKKYLAFQLTNGVNKKKNQASEQNLWDTIEKVWNKKLNSGFDYSAKRISYNNIIANALEQGPLKNYYFIVKKDSTLKDEKVKANKRFKYLTDKSGRQEVSDMKIMKIIATYLLRLKDNPECQKEVWITNSELTNWYGMDDNGNGTFYPKDVFWKGKPVYTLYRLKGNFTKVHINPEYLKEYDFKIIDIQDADQYKETHWVLEDLGHKLKDCWGIR